MKRGLFICGIMFLTIGAAVTAQDGQTPTAQPMRSIFDYDTCAPPCWMGLIPGKSTSADVERMLDENTTLIDPGTIDGGAVRLDTGEYAVDPDSGLIVQGRYSFDVEEKVVTTDSFSRSSSIEIIESVVDVIRIVSFDPISLRTIVARLGKPDSVRLNHRVGANFVYLELIYIEMALSVVVRTEPARCTVTGLSDEMMLFVMLYFSPDAAQRIVKLSPEMPPQMALTGYWLPTERPVPLETWDEWLYGEVDMSCAEAWQSLPKAPVQPLPESDNRND